MAPLPKQIKLVEVGPRDGLQSEPQCVDLATKTELVNRLGDSGVRFIEVSSFISPKRVAQMADAEALFDRITRRPGVNYSALVPNLQGMQRALSAQVDGIAVFTATSESFCQRNIGCSVEQSLQRFIPVIELAMQQGIPVRAYISCAWDCPYEGSIKVETVVRLAVQLTQLGCTEISLGDTNGMATPLKAQALVMAVGNAIPKRAVAVHFHDTRGQALANILACIEQGVAVIDSSVAGLGGCPYAAGATGNVASEDVVFMLQGMGIETGIDLEKLIQTGSFISHALGRANQSRVAQAQREVER